MSIHTTYTVRNSDSFQEENFPEITKELNDLRQSIDRLPPNFRGDIIVSFLKDHCIKTTWIRFNPRLAQVITSSSRQTAHLESLFQACRANTAFLSHFEDYIRKLV